MVSRKGIVLAGGAGRRLRPITEGITKQLLPVYDKPLVYYPLSVLMLAGIQDILLISTPDDRPNFRRLLGDGSRYGINLSYAVQDRPNGIAQSFLLGKSFIDSSPICLILGDNIFYGQAFSPKLREATTGKKGATIFGYEVHDPERFGIVEIDPDKRVLSLEEKPIHPRSNLAVTGLYFYDDEVVSIAESLSPSERGELEITDVNKVYMHHGNLTVEELGRGFAWLDTGTPDSLLEAGQFVETIEKRQGFKIACLEEIGYRMGWLDEGAVLRRAMELSQTGYGKYLAKVPGYTY